MELQTPGSSPFINTFSVSRHLCGLCVCSESLFLGAGSGMMQINQKKKEKKRKWKITYPHVTEKDNRKETDLNR